MCTFCFLYSTMTDVSHRPMVVHYSRFNTCHKSTNAVRRSIFDTFLSRTQTSRIGNRFASSNPIGQCCGHALQYVPHVLLIGRRCASVDLRHFCRPSHRPIVSTDWLRLPTWLAGAAWAYHMRALARTDSRTHAHTYIRAREIARFIYKNATRV